MLMSSKEVPILEIFSCFPFGNNVHPAVVFFHLDYGGRCYTMSWWWLPAFQRKMCGCKKKETTDEKAMK
jgi:hypothetical protein